MEKIFEEIVSLSDEERNDLLKLLEKLEQIGWEKLSEDAFAEDWQNQEDSIYENLCLSCSS